jgi:hypothetical protein
MRIEIIHEDGYATARRIESKWRGPPRVSQNSEHTSVFRIMNLIEEIVDNRQRLEYVLRVFLRTANSPEPLRLPHTRQLVPN